MRRQAEKASLISIVTGINEFGNKALLLFYKKKLLKYLKAQATFSRGSDFWLFLDI